MHIGDLKIPENPTREQLEMLWRLQFKARVERARYDVETFLPLVLRDEETGEPVSLAPMHRTWQRLAFEHNRLVIWSPIESGKTQQMSVGRVLWELGRDPTLRVAIVSNTLKQSSRVVKLIAKYIQTSPELRAVFPHLKPAIPWSATALTVERPVTKDAIKEPSVQALGLHGNILGARLDLVVMDDIIDQESTTTMHLMEDSYRWYFSTLHGRLSRRGRVVVVGTAWNEHDLLHRLGREPGWTARRFPVVSNEGELLWPERWPWERIQEKQSNPTEYARQLLCVAVSDAERRIKPEWVQACKERGDGYRVYASVDELSKHDPAFDAERRLGAVRMYTGVDLAVQQHSAADLTALFTIAVDQNDDRQVVNVETGRWPVTEVVRRIIEHHERYGSVMVVENNAAQHYVVQLLAAQARAIPVLPFTTGRNRLDPAYGIESIGYEMGQGRWIIPNDRGRCHREVQAWIDELISFDPRAHTGDRLQACWLAREGARQGIGAPRKPSVGVRVIGPKARTPTAA